MWGLSAFVEKTRRSKVSAAHEGLDGSTRFLGAGGGATGRGARDRSLRLSGGDVLQRIVGSARCEYNRRIERRCAVMTAGIDVHPPATRGGSMCISRAGWGRDAKPQSLFLADADASWRTAGRARPLDEPDQ